MSCTSVSTSESETFYSTDQAGTAPASTHNNFDNRYLPEFHATPLIAKYFAWGW